MEDLFDDWVVDQNAGYLSSAFQEANVDFWNKTMLGQQEILPRWRRCVAWADRDLGEAVGQAYAAKAFPPDSEARAEKMIVSIEAAMGEDIQQVNWMMPETKQKGLVKLKAFLDKIGYPDQWRDYSSVDIKRDNFLANVQAAAVFEYRRQLNKIGRPVDRLEWGMTPPTVNAYEDSQTNTINFPAGILQPPVFDAAADDAVNYGGIGLIMGHELTHGFDDQGRKFDAQGNLTDWWTEQDAKAYEQRGKCISDEYTQEVADLGIKTNGLLTLGEDTADNGGLRLAYMALERSYRQPGKSLDEKGGDGFTARQRFFLAHSYSWCRNWRPELARNLITTDPHSLPQFRVNMWNRICRSFNRLSVAKLVSRWCAPMRAECGSTLAGTESARRKGFPGPHLPSRRTFPAQMRAMRGHTVSGGRQKSWTSTVITSAAPRW